MNVPEKPTIDGLKPARRVELTVSTVDVRRRGRSFDRHAAPDGRVPARGTVCPTHTDVIARFQRMRGKAIFYPMGWDDNGLPTERRVQNYFGVRCDPSCRMTRLRSRRARPFRGRAGALRPELHRFSND
jgi:valyl-tRNA synthetase